MKGPKLPRMSEKAFTKMVLDLAKLRGWRTAHFRPARTARGWRTAVAGDGVGWPDIILCRGKRILALELKVGKNTASVEQFIWIEALRSAGVEACVRYPEQWADIERLLA